MDKLTRLNNLSIDIENGIIPLIGEVGDGMYSQLVDGLVSLSNAGLSYDTLTILLNTYGGELYHAFAIYDQLRAQDMKIRIVCNGPVMSAGTIILMAGDVREMTPLSFLMVHYGVDMQESHSGLKQNKRLMDTMKKLYLENSTATSKQISSWFDTDTFFTAEDALKYGLVDKVTKYAKKTKRKSDAKKSRR